MEDIGLLNIDGNIIMYMLIIGVYLYLYNIQCDIRLLTKRTKNMESRVWNDGQWRLSGVGEGE